MVTLGVGPVPSYFSKTVKNPTAKPCILGQHKKSNSWAFSRVSPKCLILGIENYLKNNLDPHPLSILYIVQVGMIRQFSLASPVVIFKL